jgi:hypothetical protein
LAVIKVFPGKGGKAYPSFAEGNEMSTYEGSNPYASPAQSVSAGTETFSETARLLGETRPWLLLFGVLAFIGAAFLGLYTLLSIPMAIMMPQPVLGLLIGLFLAAGTAIYVLIGVFLLRFASAAGSFRRQPEIATLNSAMRAQKSFWKTMGIMFLVSLVFNFVMLILVFAVGMTFQPDTMPAGQGEMFEFEAGDFEPDSP